MLRLLLPGALAVALLAVWVYCVIDVIAIDEAVVRHLPKAVWLVVVVVLPAVGALAWLALGRPPYAHWSPGGVEPRRPRPPDRRRPPLGPEDDPGW